MSDVIKLLPDSVANQIAAGEVIQRPASVIKELVENSVDAGATDIRIYIKDAGRTLIQVVDNGCGMSDTDARMAFERHATSKIRGATDLFSLHTMGFRGEALPSVCAVSQVEIKTKQKDSALGTRLIINGSKVEIQEPCACDSGTNLMVKNLFFNVPARRKFLKSDNVELSNIMREFERLALVNNHLRMVLDTGNKTFDLRPATFKQRIGDIWKNNLDLHLLPIEVETTLIKISGFVSRPEFARRRNPLQYLIVNGRNMRHPYFHKAILNCYTSLIANDTQPCYFLKFEVDPASIDVNIHPTKNEIKFEYEQEIWPILQASIKAALGKHGAVPSIDFNSDVLPVEPLQRGELPQEPTLDIPDNYNPFRIHATAMKKSAGLSNRIGHRKADQQPVRNWDSLYADFMNGARENNREENRQETFIPSVPDVDSIPDVDIPEPELFDVKTSSTPGTFCLQHGLKYIITSSREGIIIIDQHRAHVKILYESYMKHVECSGQVSQRLMFPETLRLDPEYQDTLSESQGQLSKLGFILDYDEEDKWKVLGAPSGVPAEEVCDIILRILDSVSEGGENYGKEATSADTMMERMALAMARATAIKGGRKLTDEEMEYLTSELFSLPDPVYTPNGNRIYSVITDNSLDSMFS